MSSFTTSSGSPETITLPSCKIYALSTILSVSLTLWSVMRTPILLLLILKQGCEHHLLKLDQHQRKVHPIVCTLGQWLGHGRFLFCDSPPDRASAGVLLKWSIRKSDNNFSNFLVALALMVLKYQVSIFILSSTFRPLNIEVSWGNKINPSRAAIHGHSCNVHSTHFYLAPSDEVRPAME